MPESDDSAVLEILARIDSPTPCRRASHCEVPKPGMTVVSPHADSAAQAEHWQNPDYERSSPVPMEWETRLLIGSVRWFGSLRTERAGASRALPALDTR